ncbi:WXG100 family type VII secretion target [Crossiella equi]|uniref:WXG100 family type VII secretion target n=1 Tax=Crossiella equi TaxID=130796 RepID=UPI002012C343|nr:WXG100 family type VII secretion target [Crossiella equi]
MHLDNGQTDFARYSHRQLWDMLHAGQPKTMRAAADSWDAVGARLHEQAGNLERQLDRFRHQWRGGAAEQYQSMITDLAGGLRRTAEAALAMRDLSHDAAEALVRAQATMPPPSDVPEVSAATLRMASTPIQLGPGVSPELHARVAQQQAQAVAEVRAQQQAQQVASANHARAVLIMEDLAGRYRTAEASIPESPATTPVPGGTSGVSGDAPARRPLFGGMFTSGLAAASAAAAGRFAGVLPKVPDWAKKPNPQDGSGSGTGGAGGLAGEAAKLGAGAAGLGAGLGKLGGGGGAGKVGGAGGPAPQALAGLAGGAAGAARAAGALGAAAAAAGAAAQQVGGMPMMPMMPMGGQGMGGDMGGRRIPPWLVETEDVWGESSVITPQVIGEEPTDTPPQPPFRY